MNIGFLVDCINEKSGARAPMKIAAGLAEMGDKVTVYSYPEAQDLDVEKKLTNLGVRVVYVEAPESRIGKFLLAQNLLPSLKIGNHDLISCHSSYPFFFAARFSGKPIIYTYYGTQLTAFDLEMDKETGLKRPFLQEQRLKLADKTILFLENLRIKQSARVLGISKSTVNEAAKLYHKKIDFIYLGADITSNNLPKEKEQKSILLLSISRITPYKGFHRVLSAFNNLRKYFPLKLVIIGTNINDQYLNYLKSRLTNGVEIILAPSDEILLEYYQRCSIYVSGTSWEGFGLPFLEAQLFGKPVVGFKNTSLSEVVENKKTGFLANNQEEFESFIKKLCENPHLREKMGQEAVVFAKQFTWERTVKSYQKYFENFLLEGRE